MAYLNANIPVEYAQIRREYLYDLKKHHGEVEDCIVFGVTCITGRALLFHAIMENGAVISEFPMSAKPKAMNFVQRNRLVSGLSKDIILVESTDRSGSLITAHFGLEQERNVFILAGANLSSRTSLATHRLIDQGARLVESAEEILESLPNCSVSPSQNPSDTRIDSHQFKTEDPPAPNSKPQTERLDTVITKPSQQDSEKLRTLSS